MSHIKINTLTIAAVTFLVMAVSACGGASDDSTSSGAADSMPTPVSFDDSLSLRFGTQWGAQQAVNFTLLDEKMRSEINIDDFIAGLRSAVMSDYSTPGMIDAIALGGDIAAQLDSYSNVGIYLRPSKVMSAFENVFLADTLTAEQSDEFQSLFDSKMSVVQNLILERMRQERRAATLLAEKMRKENVEKANQFMAENVKKDSQIKETKSGLFYKIDNAGEGSHPANGSTVNMLYTIKGIDGRVIDSSRGEYVDIPFNDDLISGLQEGLAMIGSGAKATFYIPSTLGFSRDNSGVEPGELIIVEVELKGVK